MTRRLPHNISTDDLLASLESAEDTETTEWENDVPHFLSHFKIEQGEYKVRNTLLYSLYKLYSKEPVSSFNFSVTAGQFVELKSPYFLLNIKPIRIAKVVNTKLLEKKRNVTANIAVKRKYEQFLQETGVKKGTDWVEGRLIHEIYRHFCIDKRLKCTISYVNFIKVTKLYFKFKRIGASKAVWFNIDKSVVSKYLTPEIIERINKERYKQTEATKRNHSIANKKFAEKRRRANDKKNKDTT